MTLFAVKQSKFEVCPGCATKAFIIYDRRTIKISDAPIRNKNGNLSVPVSLQRVAHPERFERPTP